MGEWFIMRLHRFRNKNKKGSRKISRFLLFLLFAFIFTVILYTYIENKLTPIVKTIALTRANAIATGAISEVVNDELDIENFKYEDIISFEKDTAGSITALKTNVLLANRLKAKLSLAVLNKIMSVEISEISIPLGNIVNGEILSGRGPRIVIKLIPVGSVEANIKNQFTSGGINQTRHQIIMEIKATVNIILPTETVTANVSSDVVIAETVIIGKVPESFTNVEDSSRPINEKMIDFSLKDN
ncbi:MAG: putative secreted protein [Clostridia bacterium]|nr:putative secreted protein [Clostridia bacterium]